MLRITVNKSPSGATRYFEEGLAKSDYYAEKGEITGKWGGRTAERLKLSGEVSKAEFEALAYNRDPNTGKQLTARNSNNRRVGYDFTFSVPKSVSIVYSQTKDKEILDAFHNAIDETMLEIENHAATRVRSRGKNEDRTTGNLVWGTFTHEDARPVNGIPDPHLHQHVFVFNTTYDEKEKRYKAAQFGTIKENAPYFETVFNSRLADKLQQAGYQVERNERDFELRGFERPTIEKFSNRTREVNERAEELGITHASDKAELGAKTRANKRTGFDKEDIRMQWRSRLSEKELELVQNAKSQPSESSDGSGQAMDARAALDYALDHALERKSTATERELMMNGLKRSYGLVKPEELKEELNSRKALLSKYDHKAKDTIYTTPEALEEEQALRDASRQGRNSFEPLNPEYKVKNEQLTQEQAQAVSNVLSSKDFISIVAGGAGTGKTWSIKEVAQGIQEKGINFGAFAPSSAASRQVQREDGFEEATTIAELLQSSKLQKSVKDGVIWIDEAGMVGNKTMNQVITVAKEQNARLLLTGDIKQHGAVERGDALRIIQQFGGVKPSTISKIQRQKVDDYRKAVKNISDGKIVEGYEQLDEMGAIKEAEDFTEVKDKVAGEYVASIKDKENVLIVSTTHSQGQAVTEEIRSKLREENLLKGKEHSYLVQRNLSFTDAQKSDPANYQKGMVVQFHQNVKGGFKRGTKCQVLGKDENDRILVETGEKKKEAKALPMQAASRFSVYETEQLPLAKGDQIRITQNGFSNEKKRLNNGNILSVKGFDKQGNIIASTGKNEVTIDKRFGNLTHGYYTTSPASQGKSVNRVIIMQSSMTGRAASKEQFYVSASRGKFAISIHTDDKENLLRSVQRSSHRMMATDVADSRQQMESSMKDKLKTIGSIYRTGVSKLANLKDKWQDKTAGIISMISKPAQPVKNAPARSK
jgi:conjugative relaxase-like TrwC/TraI family protein